MNCWRFDARIFQACGDVPRSVRGEYELPEAVGLAIARGMRIRAVPAAGPVLDLSRRADAIDVAPPSGGRRAAAMTPNDLVDQLLAGGLDPGEHETRLALFRGVLETWRQVSRRSA